MPNLLKSNKLKKSIVIAKKNRSMRKKARPMSKKVKSKSKKTRSKGKKTRSISKKVRSKLLSKKKYQHGGMNFTFSNAIGNGRSISVDTSGEKIILGSNKVIWVQPGNKKVISIELLTDDRQVEEYNSEKCMNFEMAGLEIGPVIDNIELFDLSGENRNNKETLESIFGRTELGVDDAGDQFKVKYNSIFSDNPPGRQILAVTKMDKLESFMNDCYSPAHANPHVNQGKQFGDGTDKPTKDQCIDVFKSLKYKTNKMWDHKIAHLDLHAGNMMYKKHQDGRFEGYLIDWGEAKKYPGINREKVIEEEIEAFRSEELATLFSGLSFANGNFKDGFRSHQL